jgi:hypothetical protein
MIKKPMCLQSLGQREVDLSVQNNNASKHKRRALLQNVERRWPRDGMVVPQSHFIL